MRRRLVTLAAVSMFVLALGAAPALAAGSPLTHASFPATDLNAPTELSPEGGLCGYTFTSGEFSVVGRDSSIAAHMTFHNVVATKDGASYKVVGSETYNDLKGHLTMKVMFVGKGGIADSLNVVFRAGRNYAPTPEDPFNGALVAVENDSCHIYG